MSGREIKFLEDLAAECERAGTEFSQGRACGIKEALAAMKNGERYVLGEGYGLGKGVREDGTFVWVGLSSENASGDAIRLRFPTTDKISKGVVSHPEKRRKFRLVLEVVEESESALAAVEGKE